MEIREESREVPPKLTNGRVIPVTGNSETFTEMLTKA